MKAILLDMYGVIVKQTGDDFVPYVQQTFPELDPEEIIKPWNKANMGEWSSLEIWAKVGWSKYLREKFNINQYFDVISISGDLKIRKPDERIFRLTIEKLAVNAAECLYVDDRRGYLGAANRLGMDTILFNSRNVPYKGDVVHNFEELMNRVL